MQERDPPRMAEIDTRRIPRNVAMQLARATVEAMIRTRRDDPEAWARIDARAAALREKASTAHE